VVNVSFPGLAFCGLTWGKRRREKGNYREGLLLDPTCYGNVDLVYKICHFVFQILLTGRVFFSLTIRK
jgi:hypothetical protein